MPKLAGIELPRPEQIARVVVHPGDRRHAGYPSTERSPKTYRLQGWIDGRWHDLTQDVHPPAYQGSSEEHFLAHEFPACRMRKFRLFITELMDEGKRVDGRVLPEGDRSVVIREVRWFTAAQLQEERDRRERLLREVVTGIDQFQKSLDSADRENRIAKVLGRRYAGALTELKQKVADADWLDSEAAKRIEQRWTNLRDELAPWVPALAGPKLPLAGRIGPGQYGLLVEVAGLTDAHSFYPISVPLDLELLEQTWGVELNPYEVWVAAVDAQQGRLAPEGKGPDGGPACRCPSRFERETPKRGRLSWLIRDPSQSRFLVTFGPKPEAPPELGSVTLGDGDRHYYDRADRTGLPGPVTSAAVVDWDGDGKQDLLCGAWPDHVHFWRNVGSRETMSFSEREHFRLRDEDGHPILAYPEHPGLGFSYLTPIDVDGDQLEDLFVNRVYGSVPKFYRNLGPRAFPRLSRGRNVPGLDAGRFAFGDLNGDGRVDAVSTRTESGKQALLWQLGTELTADGTPTFAPPEAVETAGKPLVTDSGYVFPALGDLDADGDLDLSYYVDWGHVHTCENVGGRSEPRFADPQKLMLGDEPLDIGSYHNAVRWNDADADGDLDLIATTGVRIYRNDGDRHSARLTERWSPRHVRQVEVGRHRLQGFSFVDWDADGDLDLFV
ncbi:MAG: VCBS repeat-containing protein, partial [Planctomycetes bacterium]|nr:VCBS repeat-containing protein [Planctomycetota bacterium]